MRYALWLTLLALGPATASAWGNDCKLRAERSAGIDARGVEKVVVRAGAGDLKIVGVPNAARIEARGPACASSQEFLDASKINVRREGNTVYVETALPQNESGWSWGKNDYAQIDLGVAVPNNVPIEAVDSSGDATAEDLASLTMQDSSGDLDIHRIAGLADVSDSSGDVEIDSVGSVRIRDSSGDIEIRGVHGNVDVTQDSSGEIEVTKVEGSVRVEQDSSGDIRVEDVKGSVVVDSDSSGSIYAARVGGDFTVREDTSGSIGHESIGGKVSVPSNKED